MSKCSQLLCAVEKGVGRVRSPVEHHNERDGVFDGNMFVSAVASRVDQPGRVAVLPRTSRPPEQQQRRPAVPV